MSDGPRCGVVALGSRLPCTRPLGHAGRCYANMIGESGMIKAGSAVHESMLRHPAGTQATERPNVDEAIIARLRKIRAALPEMTRPLALHVEEVDALLAAVDERDALRRELTDMPDEAKVRRDAAIQALREEAARRGLAPLATAGEMIATPPVIRCECVEDYVCWAHGCGALQPGETETTR